MSDYSKKQAERDAEELSAIKDQIESLIGRAQRIAASGPWEGDADYWYANILICLKNNHGYLASSGRTIEDTVNALEKYVDETEVLDDLDEAA